MRRAMVTNEFAPSHGGVERLLHERARGFQPESLTVFAPYTEGCEAFDRLQAYSVRRSGKPARAVPILRDVVRSLAPLLDCLRQHRRRPFGMIECGQAFPASLFAWLMRRCYGTPYMVWVHGNDLLGPSRHRLPGAMLRKSLLGAQAIITNSAYTAGIVAALGIPGERIRTIPPVVDTTRFQPGPAAAALVERYRIGDRRVLLTVCRLVERKGVDTTLEAMARLVEVRRDIVFLIVGEGPQRPDLERLVKRLNLQGHVVFCGSVADHELAAHYHLASVFVMPSRYLASQGSVEGLGLVYLEAMASGVPVIAARSGGVTDIVRDGETGLVIEPGSVTDLARALERILSDEECARRLRENGLELVRAPRDWRVLEP